MRNSKRLLATLLTLCIMASFVFTGTAFAADEAAVTLTFPAQIVNVNGTASLSLTGATADSWESSDAAIAEVDNDGVVTGKAIGKVTITAKSGEEELASIEIPVVGENLLIRNGVNYGKFEGGTESIHGTTFGGSELDKSKHAWWAPSTEKRTGNTQYATKVTVESMNTAFNSLKNALKYHIEANGNAKRQFAMRSATAVSDEVSDMWSAPYADSGKLYEFSGWIRYATDDTGMGFNTRVAYRKADGSDLFTTLTDGTGSGDCGVKTTNTSWQYFSTQPLERSNIPEAVAAQMYFQSGINSSAAEISTTDIYLADLSFHEVAYDPVFRSNSHLMDRKVGWETSTTFQHLSNTGKEVISFDANGVVQPLSVTYKSLDENVATVDSSGNIKTVGAGTAVIQAIPSIGGNDAVRTITFTVASDEDQALKAAFTPDDTETVQATVYTDKVEALPYVDGAEVVEDVIATATQLGDGTYQMSTSTTDNDVTFLYWVKGLDGGAKRVVSREESFVYTPTGGVVNYLIAVYEKNGAATPKAEFYNANGLLYGKVETASGTTPDLPSMAGYGTAKRWVAKDGTTYAGNAPIMVSETMMLIAEYDDPTEDITVTTDENCTTNKPGKEYAYGEKVTCTPTGNGTGTFYAWTKDGEIVSTDSEKYEFYAWEDCTVNAVYKEHTPITSVARKIIIDVFGNNVMAEFIGFDNAVEKGIYLDNTKITMTSKKTQFTVELGDATSAKGYAVVKNGDGTYTEYIDGSYPKSAE